MGFEGLMSLDAALGALAVIERELFLFAAFWLVLGAVDELALDTGYAWLRLRGKLRTPTVPPAPSRLRGKIAVFIPAWDEASVIGETIADIAARWPQEEVRIFIGVYQNDSQTLAVASKAAIGDDRVRAVVHDALGPTTKADCLNRLYAAMMQDEARNADNYRAVVLQDAEDRVHPDAIALVDTAMDNCSMAQLPVKPLLPAGPRFVAGHYADEFAESHAKAMVLRDAMGATLPSAGVGCAVERGILRLLVRAGERGPFRDDSLTEDYELGFRIRAMGGITRFLRARDRCGELVATRSLFPDDIGAAARQKARWVHGIAFQGWDRLGWSGGFFNRWMMLRDRRGPLAALVLAVAYLLLALEAVMLLTGTPHTDYETVLPFLRAAAVFLVFALVWRAGVRALFVWREYGLREAGASVLRIPVANIVAIMAGRRALTAYWRNLRTGLLRWDKTDHHPIAESYEVARGS